MTLAELRTQLRFILAEPSTGWLSDAQANVQINLALAQVYQAVLRNNENYFATTSLITLVADQETYTLPTTTRIIHVTRVDLEVEYSIPQIDIAQREMYLYQGVGGSTASNPWGLRYYFLGNTMGFLPVPGEAATDAIRVYHVPSSTALAADGDSPPLEWPADQQEVIALGAARRCQVRDKQRRAMVDAMYQEALEYLVRTTQMRNVDAPRGFVDVVWE